ncbi:MAG: hypothetical protein Q9186_006274 [Xanthomendoza sp. 1 TL-2023]
MAVPLTHPERTSSGHKINCTRTCTIALATIVPIVFLLLIFAIAFLAWGQPYLQRRRREKAEREAVREKVGDEGSMGVGSDVSSFDGEVFRLNEVAEKGEEGRREERHEHEHDHVLAMIGARP